MLTPRKERKKKRGSTKECIELIAKQKEQEKRKFGGRGEEIRERGKREGVIKIGYI